MPKTFKESTFPKNSEMKTLKHLSIISFFLFLMVLISCKDSKQNTEAEATNTEAKQEVKSVKKEVSANTTYLCKLNGKDWGYSEASGIVSRHKKTGKRTAIITFKKKLDKGSETVQLRYDGDTYELETVLVHLKLPKKGGGRVSGIYELFPDTRARNPDSDMSGKIDLTDPTKASGNAELINLNLKYEKELLDNMDDAVISATGIKFSGIGYSDLNKSFGSN